MAQQMDEPADLQNFAEILFNWTKENALEIYLLEQEKSKMDFNFTRCRYAEMYEEMGLKQSGHLSSCSRDADLCTGYNPDIDFERNQTIMKGASHRDFRLKTKSSSYT